MVFFGRGTFLEEDKVPPRIRPGEPTIFQTWNGPTRAAEDPRMPCCFSLAIEPPRRRSKGLRIRLILRNRGTPESFVKASLSVWGFENVLSGALRFKSGL